ncbi:MAG: amidohydrolase family protein, partial [Gammaproteobacteria bacterium]|nr:amidohydrolase family protein [Gammaproteobacteria bacterium]
GIWVSPTVNAGWARFGEAFAKVVTAGFRAMKEQGCRLVASTDAGIPNVYHHDLGRALPVFARLAELTPMQALRAATSDCAAAIGLGGVTGRVAEGFAADLVFLDRDPLSDLATLVNPVRVVAAGRLLGPQVV